MNDTPSNPDPDDVIRRALQAEGEGVEASEALLDRTLTAASRPPVRPGRRLLAVAAVIAAVAVGAAAAIAATDDDQVVDSANDPTSTTEAVPPPDGLPDLLSTIVPCNDEIVTAVFVAVEASEDELAAILESVPEPSQWSNPEVRTRLLDRYADDPAALEIIEGQEVVPSAVLFTSSDPDVDLELRGEVSDLPGVEQVTTTDCRDHTNGEQPATLALVREDGRLVIIDLATGGERGLHYVGDPNAEVEGGPQFIDAVELSPDGEWVYFSTCCEPAVGTTFRIPIGGGEAVQVAYGAYPRVSPDGRFLATAGSESLIVTPLAGGDALTVPVECCLSRLAWSPDGRQLAAIQSTGADGDIPQALLFDWDGRSLTPADTGKPENPGSFVSWTPDGMLTITSGGPVDDDRHLSQDRSYRWLLWVDEQGQVSIQDGHESSERAPFEDLPKALAADW